MANGNDKTFRPEDTEEFELMDTSAPASDAVIIDLGLEHKLAFDVDGDAQWWHPSPEHKDWVWLDMLGLHHPYEGGADDPENLSVGAKIVCPHVTCGMQGHIIKGKWQPL